MVIQNNIKLNSFAVEILFAVWKLHYGYLEFLVDIKKNKNHLLFLS